MKSKHLGVLMAALTFGLAAVSSASAAEFKSATSPVTFIGSQSTTNKLTIEGSQMSCGNATFQSAATLMPTEAVLVTPVYANCTLFGIAGNKISMNGCQYRLRTLPAAFDLSCATGKMTLFVTTALGHCKVEIPGSNLGQNQRLGSISYSNSPAGKVTVHLGVTGITAEIIESTGVCPLTKGTVTNASYSGDITLEGNGGEALIEVG